MLFKQCGGEDLSGSNDATLRRGKYLFPKQAKLAVIFVIFMQTRTFTLFRTSLSVRSLQSRRTFVKRKFYSL
jgi:hypothetical protein